MYFKTLQLPILYYICIHCSDWSIELDNFMNPIISILLITYKTIIYIHMKTTNGLSDKLYNYLSALFN